jgi:riboflavin synthase alpha subunit
MPLILIAYVATVTLFASIVVLGVCLTIISARSDARMEDK